MPDKTNKLQLSKDEIKELHEILDCNSCCSPSNCNPEEIDGICPDCGEYTSEGKSWLICTYSPVTCDTCGNAPCDLSC